MPEFQSPQPYPYANCLPHYQAPAPAQVGPPYQQTGAQLLQDRNATVAKVTLTQHSGIGFGADPDFQFTATGSSKREQGDKFNARTGELMSLSRAYLKLSRQLMSAARELVEPEPAQEYLVPPEFVAGAQEYEGAPAWPGDPTDEDVASAREILTARAEYNAFVAEHGEEPDWDAEAQAETDVYDEVVDPLVNAVESFNDAADALNSATAILQALTNSN